MERRKPLKRTGFKPPTKPRFKPPTSDGVPKLVTQRKPIAPVSATKKRRREQKAGPSMAELRPILWERCRGVCERCGRHLDYDTFEAHHRKFRSRGGLDRIENLAALCGDDHRWAHANNREAGLAGFTVTRTANPAEIPMHVRSALGVTYRVLLTPEGTYRKASA